MSTNIQKAKGAKNQRAKNKPVRNGTPNLAGLTADAEGARRFWSIRVAMGEPKKLGMQVPRGVMIMHNRGPSGIIVRIGDSHRDVILPAGETQIVAVYGEISVANVEVRPSTFEFEYTPLPK